MQQTHTIPAEAVLGALKRDLTVEATRAADRRDRYTYPCDKWYEENAYHKAILQALSLINLLIDRREMLAAKILGECAKEYEHRYQIAARVLVATLNENIITADYEKLHDAQGTLEGWAFIHRHFGHIWNSVKLG